MAAIRNIEPIDLIIILFKECRIQYALTIGGKRWVEVPDIIFSRQTFEIGAIGFHDADLFCTLIFEDLAGEDDMSAGLVGGRWRWNRGLPRSGYGSRGDG